jgi:hypothetical protein
MWYCAAMSLLMDRPEEVEDAANLVLLASCPSMMALIIGIAWLLVMAPEPLPLLIEISIVQGLGWGIGVGAILAWLLVEDAFCGPEPR